MTATHEADLAGGHADRSWETRLKAWTRPSVLILDDFACESSGPARPTIYELVTERTKKSLIITVNRAANDWYSLFNQPRGRRIDPRPHSSDDPQPRALPRR
jgi:DNA replication protein DnaC